MNKNRTGFDRLACAEPTCSLHHHHHFSSRSTLKLEVNLFNISFCNNDVTDDFVFVNHCFFLKPKRKYYRFLFYIGVGLVQSGRLVVEEPHECLLYVINIYIYINYIRQMM